MSERLKNRIILQMRIVGMILCVLVILFSSAYESKAEERGNLVYVAYDDSGSMLYNGSTMVDRWCQAKYALQVFSAMMLEQDEMKVFPLNQPESGFSVNGSMTAEERKQIVSDYQVIYGSYTPFATVEAASQELLAAPTDKNKWLLVLTDGTFNDSYTHEEVQQRFYDYAGSGINVIYLRIVDLPEGQVLDESAVIKGDPENGLFTYTAEKSTDILSSLIQISNIIFKRQALSEYNMLSMQDGKIVITLDAPVEQLIVFGQGEGISFGNLQGDALDLPSASALRVERPDIVMNETISSRFTPDMIKYAEGLGGLIAAYQQTVIPKGTYTIEVSEGVDISNIEIYCKLAVDIDVSISQDGIVIQNGGVLKSGSYQVAVKLLDPSTLESLNSVLLDPVSYQYSILNTSASGEQQSETVSASTYNGNALAGTMDISGRVQVRDISYEIPSAQFTVEDPLAPIVISGSVSENGFNGEYLEKKESWITVTVTQNGGLLDESDWNATELSVTGDEQISYDVERGTEVSTWRVYPHIVGDVTKETLGEHILNVYAKLNKGSQTQEANATIIVSFFISEPQFAVTISEVPEYQLEFMPDNAEEALKGMNKNGDVVQPIEIKTWLDGEEAVKEQLENTQFEISISGHKDIEFVQVMGTGDKEGCILVYPYVQIKSPHMVFKDIEAQLDVKAVYSHLQLIELEASAQADIRIARPGREFMFRYWGRILWIVFCILIIIVIILGYTPFFKGQYFLKYSYSRTVTGSDGLPVTALVIPPSAPVVKKAKRKWLSVLCPYKPIQWKVVMPTGSLIILKKHGRGSFEILNREALGGKALLGSIPIPTVGKVIVKVNIDTIMVGKKLPGGGGIAKDFYTIKIGVK